MRIGINARFLRKPGTGIGQVTVQFLKHLSTFELPGLLTPRNTDIRLYCEEVPDLPFSLPPAWNVRVVRPWYERDDLIREHLFERFTLPRESENDGCGTFFSLYQSATVLSPTIRHIMLVHDLAPLHFPEYLGNSRKRYHYERVVKAIGSARALVTPSVMTADDVVAKLHILREAITVAPLGLSEGFLTRPDQGTIHQVLSKYHLEPGYMYHGGGLEKRKNTRLLLEAYAALLARGTVLPPLVISGKVHASNNVLATDVHWLIKTFRLGERVKVLGFVPEEDLPSLYAGSLCFVYPSLFEGFGLPVLEALALGVPTLTSNTSALPEVAGSAALMANPTDLADLTEKLLRLVEDETLRTELAVAGPLRAALFRWEGFVEKVWPLLVQ